MNRYDTDFLPIRDTTNSRIESSKRAQTRVNPFDSKKKVSKTVREVLINAYFLVVIGFIIYHLDLLKSSFFPSESLYTIVKENADQNFEYQALQQNQVATDGIKADTSPNSNSRQRFNESLVIDSKATEKMPIKRKELIFENNSNLRSPDLSPLRFPVDYEKFTIRINTWKRPEQLKASVEHYLTCSSVGQIQIVWCVAQGEPPLWLKVMEQTFATTEKKNNGGLVEERTSVFSRLIIERHQNNTLNERFLVLEEVPTAGVLSVDDDVIRPCIAINNGFIKWTLNPERQVGFDARSHSIETTSHTGNATSSSTPKIWSYAYMSTTEKLNRYSITLTRFSFLHRDYLKSYWVDMPSQVRSIVAEKFNCEDIAMSLWISSCTRGKPPLLADYWAVKSQIKMYVPNKISAGEDHKATRNMCFDEFANIFQLKERLRYATLFHRKDEYGGFFYYGDYSEDWNVPSTDNRSLLMVETDEFINRWKSKGINTRRKELRSFINDAAKHLFNRGLLENTRSVDKAIL